MKKFLNILLSDSNKISMKRFIGLICLGMFVAYGIAGILNPFNLQFWVFYVSLCVITIWIAFKFMSAEKILKYDVIGKLSKLPTIKNNVDQAINSESGETDNIIDEFPLPPKE
jgi:hypothetical protein